MSLIKQSDVKNHLSPRYRTKIHLAEPASQPDATGFSGEQPERTDQLIRSATGESLPQPGTVPAVGPLVSEPDLKPIAVPAISKSAKA